MQDVARDKLTQFRARLGSELAAAFDEPAARLKLFAEDGPGYFFHPLALPVLQLPVWVAGVAARQGSEVPEQAVADAVESAVTGYLHVRVQDDLLDEGTGAPGRAMLLAEAFLVRHHVLLARTVPGDSDFWPLYEERWLSYGDAMLWEERLHAGAALYDREAYERVLERSRPMVLPAAAVLARAGLSRLVGDVDRFVVLLTTAHQLYTDLIDAEKDLRNGNLTWLVRRFGGAESAETLRRRLYLEGGFDEVIREVGDLHDEAQRTAEGLGMPEASGFLQARREHAESVQQEVFRTVFEEIFKK